MTTLLLVHGGLWEPGMDAGAFWRRPGVVAALEERGFDVLAPDRSVRAPSWPIEAEHLAGTLPAQPVTVVAGSNGCSAAMRLALARPDAVARLLLAWPATAGDARIDARTAAALAAAGATPETVTALLAGETLRGVTEPELAGLTPQLGLVPADPPDPFHQRRTVDALATLVPGATVLPGCTESPRPDFGPDLDRFADAVAAFAG
ncbi:alpha/beta fold hydrolase [Jiangella endophytica]|uniref:alpha/beta fold hydrolase n=1 Tax=Jiangella endophytica TaxID=1623398 RepID=UPI0018E55AF1|nr:alpha/beta hydrolase [Jiangella endophytica]